MKINKASYLDDDSVIWGVLVERFLRKPVFYAADPRCGWDHQVITKAEEGKIDIWHGFARVGKFRVRGGTEGMK